MREGKYEKAKAALEALLSSDAGDLVDRARVHLTACERQMKKDAISFHSPEEQYDYAISLLNTGYYEDAREQFDAILKKHPTADYAHYGLAVMHCLTGRAEDCLEQLARAIELNPQNRIQARLDSDFQEMTRRSPIYGASLSGNSLSAALVAGSGIAADPRLGE